MRYLLCAVLLACEAYTVYPAFVTRDTFQDGKTDVYALGQPSSATLTARYGRTVRTARTPNARILRLAFEVDHRIN